MSDYSQYRYLDVTVEDGIARILLNKPEQLNACELEDHRELGQVLRQITADPNVRVAVVTGAGAGFCVGGSLDLLDAATSNHDEVAEPLFQDARELILAHVDCDKPIVAAVNGYAMGAGAAFALLCDFIVMERQAKIADGHVRAAIAAGDGGALIWPLTVGMTKAKQYLLTGDALDACEAERIGLVTEVVDEGDALPRASQIAQRLATGPQRAIRYSKRALNQWLRLGITTSFDYSLALETITMNTHEASAAVKRLQDTKEPAMPKDSASN